MNSVEALYPVDAHGIYPTYVVFVAPPGPRPDWQTLTLQSRIERKTGGRDSYLVSSGYGKSGP